MINGKSYALSVSVEDLFDWSVENNVPGVESLPVGVQGPVRKPSCFFDVYIRTEVLLVFYLSFLLFCCI